MYCSMDSLITQSSSTEQSKLLLHQYASALCPHPLKATPLSITLDEAGYFEHKVTKLN